MINKYLLGGDTGVGMQAACSPQSSPPVQGVPQQGWHGKSGRGCRTPQGGGQGSGQHESSVVGPAAPSAAPGVGPSGSGSGPRHVQGAGG